MITQHNFKEEFSDQLRCLARNDPSLIGLNLSFNQIGDTGAASIAQALSFNSTLTTLDLSNNKIGDKEATAISQALTSNSTFTALNLDKNKVSPELKLIIRKHLETYKHNKIMHAKTLQRLCCSSLSFADKNILKIDFPSFYSLYFII